MGDIDFTKFLANHSGPENIKSPGKKTHEINFFLWNCIILAGLNFFSHFKFYFWPFLKLQKLEFGQIKFFVKLIYLMSRLFWPWFFKIFWPPVQTNPLVLPNDRDQEPFLHKTVLWTFPNLVESYRRKSKIILNWVSTRSSNSCFCTRVILKPASI